MVTINVDFEKDLKITEFKEDINLLMFNSPDFSTDDMKITNEVFNLLKNVKLQINII